MKNKKGRRKKTANRRPRENTTKSKLTLFKGSGYNFHWDSEKFNRKAALVLIAAIYVLYVIWGLASEGTWDEDCPTRYFNALDAFHNPYHFVSAWNRPLWILIFALPAHLGTFTVPVIMAFISCLGAWFLYRGAAKDSLQHAYMVIPLLLLQPYFFGVGRDAMTEPLAATLIAAGYFFLKREKFLAFAIMGALIPLARIELSFLLLIWAWLLLWRKQWKLIPVLGGGLLLWHLAGWIIQSEPLFLYNEVLTRGGENRYGHDPFGTYFSRYFYVIGPVVFSLLITGIIDRLLTRKFTLFIDGQLVAGFMLYTLFAWKLDLGQSAGFLRNLIPLSPLVALIALSGLNRFTGFLEGARKHWPALAGMVTACLLTALFFRHKIALHHIIKEDQFDPFNLPIVGGLLILLLIGRILRKTGLTGKATIEMAGLALLLAALMAHTLITEPPDANMNSERELMTRLAKMHKQTKLRLPPQTLCNYNWFHWAGKYNRNGKRFAMLTQENLQEAPPGSIVIWEPHFSNRLSGDVPLETLQTNDEYDQLALFTAKDFSRNMYVFRKRVPGENREATLKNWTERALKWPEAQVARASQLMDRNQLPEAENYLRQALAADSSHTIALNMLAQLHMKRNETEQAEVEIRKALKAGSNYPVNYHILGNIHFNRARYAEAAEAYTRAIDLNDGVASFYYNRGLSYLQLNNKPLGCVDLKKAKELGGSNAQAMIDQYCQ